MCENILSIYAYICWVYAVRPGVGSKLSEYMERAQIKRGGNAVLGILYKFVFTLFFFYYFVYLFTHKVWPFFLFLFCCFSFFIGILRLGSASNSPVRLQVCVQLCICVCVWGQKLRFLFVLFYCFSYLWKAKPPRMWSLLLLPLLLLTGKCDSSRRVQRTMWNVFRLLACLCLCVCVDAKECLNLS